MSQLKASLRRWRDILGYSVVGAVLAIPAGSLIAQTVEGVAIKLLGNAEAGFSLSLGIYLVAFWVIGRQIGARVRHFRHLLAYPPILTTISISFWMTFALLSAVPSIADGKSNYEIDGAEFFVAAAIATVVTIALAGIATKRAVVLLRRDQQRFHERPVLSKDIFSMSQVELSEWLSSEVPISRSSQDMFGADERARRVAKALKTERNDECGKRLRQTVVIQGPFGAGKSSVVRLAEDYLRTESNELFIFVSVQCWGFSSVSAQEHILEKAIEKLSEEVDCLLLRSIPSAYVDAINETNSSIGAVFRVLNPGASPVDHLKRFTPVLETIGAQLVVIIEDTDRNGADFDQKHIEAMLHNFREVERISFVLTAGSKSEIEFPKIAEHILFLPPLPEDKVLTLLDRVRQQCRNDRPFVDPTVGDSFSRNRLDSLRGEGDSERLASGYFGKETSAWVRSVGALLNTPRKLKQTLSAISNRWELLRGEVDIDELIVLTALRICAPGIFSFFGTHFRDFESLYRHQGGTSTPDEVERRKARVEFVRGRWNKAVDESEYDPSILGAIIAELIPSSASLVGLTVWTHGTRCQSIRSKRADVYWERLTSESLADGELRDQDVLSVLTCAGSDEGIAVLGKRSGESRDFAVLVTFFHGFSRRLIKGDHLARAAAIGLNLARPFERNWFTGYITAYEAIVRWVEYFSFDSATLRDWLKQQLDTCMPRHIEDGNRLFHDIVGQLENDDRQSVRRWMVARCKSVFEQMNAQEFSACFGESNPYTLGHLIRLDRKESEALFTRAQDWRWLAPLLLQSLEECPQIMVPQVMMAYGKYGPGGQMPTFFNFDEAEMEVLFGAELPRAVSLLAQEFTVSEATEGWFRLAVPLGKKKVQEWKLRLSRS